MALEKSKNMNEYMFNEGYISFPQPLGCIDTLIEWEKWLSYQPENEIKRRREIKDKDICLTLEDLRELQKYKDRVVMAKLFKKYNEKKCSYNEYKALASFIKNPIEEYMVSVLTEEELMIANQKIEEYSKFSNLELNQKVVNEQKIENYKKLSMIDAYVLHMISIVNHTRNMEALDKTINTAIEQNKVLNMKRKSAC